MTVSSMTGFGSAQMSCPLGLVQVDIRSVNNRFFELSLRLPDDLRSLEPLLRDRLSRLLPRGKVEVRISILRESMATQALPAMHRETLEGLLALQSQLEQANPGAIRPWGMAELLAFPGVLQPAPSLADDSSHEPVMAVFESALQGLEAILLSLLQVMWDPAASGLDPNIKLSHPHSCWTL